MATDKPTPLEATVLGEQQPMELYRTGDDRAAVVVILPALGIPASYYTKLARRLPELGLHALLLDYLGQGKSPTRASRAQSWGYRELVVDQLDAATAALRHELPDSPVLLLGHSLGGHIAMMRAGHRPEQTAGVLLVATGLPYWRCWSGRQALSTLFFTQSFGALSSLMGYYPGDRIGFGGREARDLIQQWSRLARTGAYRFDDFDGELAIAQIDCPILAVHLEGDALAPKPSMDALLAKTNAAIERWEWPSPDGKPLDHNKWPRSPEPFLARLEEWLQTQPQLQPQRPPSPGALDESLAPAENFAARI